MRKPYGHYEASITSEPGLRDVVRAAQQVTSGASVIILTNDSESFHLLDVLREETATVTCVSILNPDRTGTGLLPTVTDADVTEMRSRLPDTVNWYVVHPRLDGASASRIAVYTGTAAPDETDDAAMLTEIVDTVRSSGCDRPVVWAYASRTGHRALAAISAAQHCWLETLNSA